MNELSSRFTPIDDTDIDCDRTEATLAIYNVDPDLVTQKLGVTPSRSQKKGVPRIMRSGKQRIGRVNSWLLESENEVKSKDLRRHLDWVLDKVEPVVGQILEIQQYPNVKMSIRCVWWSAEAGGGSGPTLWPEQMRRMAQLNLECNLCFAYYGNEE